jgi:hypothetical protein
MSKYIQVVDCLNVSDRFYLSSLTLKWPLHIVCDLRVWFGNVHFISVLHMWIVIDRHKNSSAMYGYPVSSITACVSPYHMGTNI